MNIDDIEVGKLYWVEFLRGRPRVGRVKAKSDDICVVDYGGGSHWREPAVLFIAEDTRPWWRRWLGW